MNRDTRNMLKYLKEDEQVEVPSYGSFRNQILNDLEMYYEDLANEDDDVFAGTQDSYANEMVEQHLFDTLYYNIKHNYDSEDAAMQTANNLVYYILDFVDHGEEITLQNDKVIKEVYDKYVLNKTDESMNESDERADINEVLSSNLNGVIEELSSAKFKLTNQDNWYHQLDNTSIVFNYENLITDFDTLIERVKEFQSSLGGGNNEKDS